MKISKAGSLQNFIQGLQYFNLWLYLANIILTSRFRNSSLGILWLVIHNLAFAAGAGYIWATIFHADPRYFIPFVGVGFAVWNVIATCFVDGSFALVTATGYLKQIPIPQSVFIIRYVFAQTVFALIGIVISVLVAVAFGQKLTPYSLLAIPGFVLLMIGMFGTVLILSYIGARFRDVPHALQGLFQFLFVLTPVIYSPEILINRGLGWAVYGNPFNAFINVIRVPIMNGSAAQTIDYGICLAYGVSSMIIGLLVYRKMSPGLVYDL